MATTAPQRLSGLCAGDTTTALLQRAPKRDPIVDGANPVTVRRDGRGKEELLLYLFWLRKKTDAAGGKEVLRLALRAQSKRVDINRPTRRTASRATGPLCVPDSWTGTQPCPLPQALASLASPP